MFAETPLNHDWMRFTRSGEGAPVILLHGIAASRNDWQRLSPHLAAAGYQVFAPDLLGHGESYQPGEYSLYSLRSVAAVLERWIDSLALDRPPYLVGHSLGGYLSLDYSLRHPGGVRGLVLIDPFYTHQQVRSILRRLNRRPEISGRAIRLTPEWLLRLLVRLDVKESARFPAPVRRQIAADIKRSSPHILRIVASAGSLTPQLSSLSAPVSVIWGENDQTLDPASFPRLVFSLPDASGHPIPGSGHQPHIGNPQLVNRLVLEFIQSVDARQNGATPASVDGAIPTG